MFCKNCGAMLPDDAKFCKSCGEQTTAAAPEQEAYVAAPAQEVYTAPEMPAQEAPVQPDFSTFEAQQEDSPFAQVNFETEEAKPKKKKKGLVAILISVVALILVGTLLFFFVIKPNFSPEAKFKKAEMAALTGLTDDFSKIYGAFLSNETATGYAEAQMKFNIGTEILDMFEELLAAEDIDIPMDWLQGISIKSIMNVTEDASQIKLDLALDDKTVVDVDIIADTEKEEMYIGIPSLTDKYLSVHYSSSSASTSVMTTILSDPAFKEALPTEDELNDLLDKYIEVIFDNFNDVSKEKTTIEVDGISQSVTVLKVNISTKTIVNIAEDVLKEVKNDKQIKEIINDVCAYLETQGLLEDSEGIYETFSEGVSQALTSMDEAKSMADNTTMATYSCYLDSKDNVTGRALEVMEEKVLYYATARDGESFATIFDMADSFKVEGSGTEDDGVMNATYTVSISDGYSDTMEIIDISLVNFSAEDEKLNGSIRLIPSEDLLEEMGLDSSSASLISIVSPALEVKFDSTGDKTVTEINLLNGENVLFGFSTEGETSDTPSGTVQFPSASNIISYENAEEWAKSIDLEALMEALENSSIPDELLEGIFEATADEAAVLETVPSQPATDARR